MSAASTVLGVIGSIQQGKAANQAAKAEAAQRAQIAGQTRALGQRRAAEERRRADLANSRALAVGAAQGGALDPSLSRTMAAIEGEGEFNALAALYDSEQEARNQEFAGSMARYEGKLAKKTATMDAVGGLLSGATSFAEKYQKFSATKSTGTAGSTAGSYVSPIG